MNEYSAIQNQINLYNDAVNSKNWSILTDVFANEAAWEIDFAPEWNLHGAQNIANGLAAMSQEAGVIFQSNSPAAIRIDGDRAWARSAIIEYIDYPNQDIYYDVMGTYADDFILEDGKWKIARRQFILTRRVPKKIEILDIQV